MENLPEMLRNVQASLPSVWAMLMALAYVLGFWFVGIAVLKLKQYGHATVMMSTHASMATSMAYFFVGVGLLFLPTLLDAWIITAWAYDTTGISGYTGQNADFMEPVFRIIQVLGLISFLRGWISLVKLGSGGQPGTLSKGLMHIIGGILAINITGTVGMLQTTLGVH